MSDDFATFKVQTVITGILKNISHFHIGSNDNQSLENEVIKIQVDGKKVPYIPGSSIKGVFRAFAERLVDNDCDPSNLCVNHSTIDNYETGKIDYCLVCKVFGGFNLKSHISIEDAIPNTKLVRTTSRTRTAIHRKVGTAKSGALMTFELVQPKQEFKFRMGIENIEIITNGTINDNDERTQLLWNCIKAINLGIIQIGNSSSIGLGKFKLTNLSITKTEFNSSEFTFNEIHYNLSDDLTSVEVIAE